MPQIKSDLSKKERQKIASKKFKENHPGYFRDYYRQYLREPRNLKTRVLRSQKAKAYYQKNRVKILARNKAYKLRQK